MRCSGSGFRFPCFWTTQLLLPLAWCAGLSAQENIRFEDIAAAAGVRMVVDNCETPQKYQIEPMIAGVALFDFDNDGLLDIFVTNGAEIPRLEKSSSKYYNRLFRNQGQLRFVDVSENAGVLGSGYSMGAAAGDYDNDGWVDLYVTGVNKNILYRNQGTGFFEDVTGEAGVSGYLSGFGKAWSVGAGWLDYDNDGDLDLFVVNYCAWSSEDEVWCGGRQPGYRTYCHPDYYAPLPNILYRNDGEGKFVDVSVASGIGGYAGKGMGASFADYDGDGFLDIFISNDAFRNFLFHNQGDGRFEELGLLAGVAYIDEAVPVSGMGADFKDYDGDGRPDIFMTALSNETFPIFRNLGDGTFVDERFPSGLGVSSLPWSGWSLGMVDFDNDGWLDLFTAGGHVQTNEELYSNRPSRQTSRVFRNLGDRTFQDVTSSCGEALKLLGLHRGAAFGDVDNDGRVDAVVTRLNEPVEILHNQTRSPGHFLLLDLKGVSSNRDGLGAIVTARLPSGKSVVRHASTAVGYGGSSDKRVHIGLGQEQEVVALEIAWPSGSRQIMRHLPADALLRIVEEEESPHRQAVGTPVN